MFPPNFKCAVAIDKLIEAGFQYRGGAAEKADSVKCRYCANKFYGWKHKDDPMKLHRKYCPKCPFVIAAAAAAASKPPPPMQHTTIVYVAQQLGYSAEQINAAITACAHNYNKPLEIGNVLDQLAQYDEDVDIDTDIPSVVAAAAPRCATAVTTTNMLDMTCKVCMNSCIQYVFLTCRHACCCDNCALTIMDKRDDCQCCPVCKEKITGSLRIYFAHNTPPSNSR
jgi:hypothetical protein